MVIKSKIMDVYDCKKRFFFFMSRKIDVPNLILQYKKMQSRIINFSLKQFQHFNMIGVRENITP